MSAEKKKLNTEVELLKALVRSYPLLWCVVFANPKCERRAFMGLMEAGVIAHLPEESFERKQPRSKKKFTVRKPIFTRYLFAGIDPANGQDWSKVQACDGVEGIVSLDGTGRPYLIDRLDMVSLIDRLNTGERIADGSFIQVGKVLQLVKGPFSGFDVRVTAYEAASETFRGEVSVFGRSTPLTASVDDLGR
ncbi:transcription termination/antitermination NusG family protein [uncultured Roseibium sp.]|uniref:transcription termination/antitermination NusG family protein n=1 Tax=uncultured Roseibium sp. TaxID=1936171 RepID=UPI002616A4BF|nr:transcription termination/antitermination NusG family protein [uncultured Roseibium sp.]